MPYVTGDTEETYIVFNMGHPCLDKTLKGTTTKCLALQPKTQPTFGKTRKKVCFIIILEFWDTEDFGLQTTLSRAKI